MSDLGAHSLRSGMQPRGRGRDLSRLAAREALRDALEDAQPVKRPGTSKGVYDVYEYDHDTDEWVLVGGEFWVLVHMDGDPGDNVVLATLLAQEPLDGDRVMVEFVPTGGVYVDGLIGGHV